MIAILTLVLEFLFMSMFNGAINQEDSTFLAFVMIAVFSISYVATIVGSEKLSKFSIPLVVGYIWRLFLLFFDLYGKSIYNLPNSGYDSEMYYRTAVSFVSTGNSGQGGMFSTVMGTIFSFIGTNRVYGQFLVMLTSIVSLCVFVQILCLIDSIDENVKYRTVGIVALLPNFAILSSIYLRESIITMFITVSLYFFVRWFTGGKEVWFFGAFILAFCAALFHSGSAAVAIGYIAARLLYDHKEQEVRMRLVNIVPAIFFVAIVAFLYINYADDLFGKMNNINSIADIGSTNTEGGSSYAAYVGNSSSVANMVIYTIPRIVYFLFSPFPWQWRGLGDIIAFVFSSLFYLSAIKNAISNIRFNGQNRNQVIVVLVVALCTAFVFAWGVTNTGTATRHRDKMIMIYALLYALSHCGDRDKIITIRKFRLI